MDFRRVARASAVLAITAGAALIQIHAVPHSTPVRCAEAQSGSFIVEASSTSAARSAVQSVGGRTTAELPIIGAVAAQLTASQRTALKARPGIRSVFEDASVELKSEVSSVRDNFERVQWDNNDGKQRWSTPWTESGDDGSPLLGKVTITPALLASGRLAFTGRGGAVTRKAGLPPGALKASLELSVRRTSLEADDYLSIQASRDGYTWTEIGRVAGPANDAGFSRLAFDMNNFIGSDTSVRLVSQLNPALLNADAVYIDSVELKYDSVYETGVSYPSLAGADKLHAQGVTGLLTTVAVLDTGYWKHPSLDTTALGLGRVLAQYDALGDGTDASMIGVLGLTSLGSTNSTDNSGHGTHVTGIMLNKQRTADGRYFGIAPNANLVSVRAFDSSGRGTYSSVIRGIDWVVQNKSNYRIRVLNLSLGAAPRSHYWEDPLNRAVMKAWKAGIVVVVSAGNGGPGPQTITVPGNVPYVITVGAMTDNFTPDNPADDRLASFSATGPTYEGFVKPEVVAPGGHIWSLMPTYARIAQDHPAYQNDGDFFTMSGTSQAAAVVSGIAALLTQAEPGLSPDAVKCKLMASARPALNPAGRRAYSVFQQGAGLINAYDARNEPKRDCANRGLDIDKDLAGTAHYGGPARQSSNGDYYLANGSAEPWDQSYAWDQGYLWRQNSDDSDTWNEGYLWRQNADDETPDGGWEYGYPWSAGSQQSGSATMSINSWAEQE